MTKTQKKQLQEVCSDFKKSAGVVTKLYFIMFIIDIISANIKPKNLKDLTRYRTNIKKLIFRDYIHSYNGGKISFHKVKRLKPCKEYNPTKLTNNLEHITHEVLDTFITKIKDKKYTINDECLSELTTIGNFMIGEELKYTLKLLDKIR